MKEEEFEIIIKNEQNDHSFLFRPSNGDSIILKFNLTETKNNVDYVFDSEVDSEVDSDSHVYLGNWDENDDFFIRNYGNDVVYGSEGTKTLGKLSEYYDTKYVMKGGKKGKSKKMRKSKKSRKSKKMRKSKK